MSLFGKGELVSYEQWDAGKAIPSLHKGGPAVFQAEACDEVHRSVFPHRAACRRPFSLKKFHLVTF